jgi:uncharacterized membrane protein
MVTASSAGPAEDRERSSFAGRRTAIVLASSMLVGFALRSAFAGRSGLWRDEAQFLWIVRIPSLSEMSDFLWHHESHPPLFYLLMRAWLGLFGDSEAAAVALPIILGVVLIPVAYRVGHRVFSHRAGLIAAMFVAASPLLASYSGTVRPYSLLPLLCLLSIYWLWDGLSARSVRPWAAHVIASLAMLMTHNWAWIVLGAEWIIAAAWLALRCPSPGRTLVRNWALAQVAILLGYSPWLPVFLHQSRHAGYDANLLDSFHALAVFAFACLVETALSLPVVIGTPVLAVIILAAALRAGIRRISCPPANSDHRLALCVFGGLPLLAFAISVAVSIKRFLLFPQCLTAIVPCTLLTIAYGVASFSSMPRIFALMLVSLYLVIVPTRLEEVKSNAREAAAAVAMQSHSSDIIVITPWWIASSFNYYYHLDNEQENYPHEGRSGAIYYDHLRERLLDPEPMSRLRARLVQARRDARRVWLVTDRAIPSAIVPEGDRLPENLGLHSFGHVGDLRARQIRKQLGALFGPPSTIVVPKGDRKGLEILEVLLYAGEADSHCCPDPDEPGRRGLEAGRLSTVRP